MCWWWRKVRVAEIPKPSRDIFERFGETVIGNVIAGGLTPAHPDLVRIYQQQGNMLAQAASWLTERGDRRERREQRLETVEWLLFFAAVLAIVVTVLIALGWIGRCG
jgi:hypothetical protein